jgi:hypothetical protein
MIYRGILQNKNVDGRTIILLYKTQKLRGNFKLSNMNYKFADAIGYAKNMTLSQLEELSYGIPEVSSAATIRFERGNYNKEEERGNRDDGLLQLEQGRER